MNRVIKKGMVSVLSLVLVLTMLGVPVFAQEQGVQEWTDSEEVVLEEAASEEADFVEEILEEADSEEVLLEESAPEEESLEKSEEEDSLKEKGQVHLKETGASKGAVISGTFAEVTDKDIATVRYFTNSDKSDYAFANVSYDEAASCYRYEFEAPYEGFEAVEGTSLSPNDTATIIAQYYTLSVWDGAVDVSWYNDTDTDFYLYYPAELAGLAAIVNGSIDGDICDYQVKGNRKSPSDRTVNRGLPEAVSGTLFKDEDLIAGVIGDAWKGDMQHDFSNRTIHIMEDMDMGGAPGDQIVHSRNTYVNPKTKEGVNAYDYPNWTPIGGEYLMDVSDPDSMIIAFFNGVIEGHGHYINNLYCYRWSWPSVGETAYGYAQGTGFVGDMGTLYDDTRGKEENPEIMPAIRDLGLTGYIFGRRMVGGFVGCIGGGSNAADGSTVPGGIALENLANHAYCYCTDSKGIGGIVGCSMSEGSVINCYNTGNLDSTYGYPTGGIIGANETMDVFCCYNTGRITSSTKNGRGIGSTGGTTGEGGYTVDNCYYLEGCGDDLRYPGYYDYNVPATVSVTVTAMTAEQMQSEDLLNGLNVNGTAYVVGDDGYPVLYWEKSDGSGSLSLVQPEGGTVGALRTGSIPAGTVVYLNNTEDTGFVFRNYIRNGKAITADYVTVDESDCTVSAYFEAVQAGVLKVEQNAVCDIAVTKNGLVKDEDGNMVEVKNYPVAPGDSLYEGDLLVIEASIREGAVPEDPSLQYSATAGLAVPYDYEFSYTGKEPVVRAVKTFTVGPEINEPETVLTVNVLPRTTQKLWRYIGDTSWYNEQAAEFTLSTAEELAGLQKLVNEGVGFEGVTIKLGDDISLVNNDGTTGTRFWDGIGTTGNPFKGSFDGCGHKITDYAGNMYGFFACVNGTETARAAIRNLEIYGTSTKTEASGLVSRAKYTDIENVTSFCKVENGTGYCGGIIGYAQAGVNVSGCVNYGKVEGLSNVGGIAGSLAGGSVLSNCINKGDVYCLNAGGNSVGGIAGSTTSMIENCANYGTIEAWGLNVGGIAGQSVSAASQITESYNAGAIYFSNGTGSLIAVGGILGYGSYYKISNSFNYGPIYAEDMPDTNHLGGIIGRDAKRKNGNTTDNVYFLDTSCEYAEEGIPFADLPEVTYVTGMRIASAEEFADPNGVIAQINGNGSFVLNNAMFPELLSAAGGHVHSGGTASCSAFAVCETCGLEYGTYDPFVHLHFKTANVADAVWAYDGYTGDEVCADCGAVVENGTAIPADLNRQALEVEYKADGQTVKVKRYTVAQMDAIKTTGKVGYTYGFDSKGNYTNDLMAATEYIQIEDILQMEQISIDDIDSISVHYAGNKDTVSKTVLQENIYYFDADGNRFIAPPALCIAYNALEGTLDQAAAGALPTDILRFAYGMSQKQYDDKASLGGRRLVSPVDIIEVNLPQVQSDVDHLELVEEPQYTVYHIGDTFCPDGIVLKAHYADGSSEIVTDYEISNLDPLYPEDESVLLLYGWKSLEIPITVSNHEYDEATHKCIGLHYDGTVCGLVEQVDTADLEAAIESANKNLAATYVSEDGKDVYTTQKWVTADVKAAFREAVSAAQAVLDDSDISQKKADAAARDLRQAGQAFDAQKQAGSKVAVKQISFEQTEQTINYGQRATLAVTFLPENATDKNVSWASSNEEIVYVDENGVILGVNAGSAVVTATSADGGKTAECTVTVTGIPVTGVTLIPEEMTVDKEDVLQFAATVSPANASNKKVSWSSSDETIVKIENDGKAWALKYGVAVVTVTTEDGGFTASCTITVQAPVINVKSIKLNKTEAELAAGKTLQLTAMVLPTNATNKDVIWTSSNTDLAEVDQTGKVTAKKYGAPVTITVTSKADDSIKASCTIQTRFTDATKENVDSEMFKAIYWAADKKITGETVKFGTNNSMTRGQFVRFLYRYAGNPKVTSAMIKKYGAQFKDVDKKYTHFNAIVWAVSKGLIGGYSDGTFKPEKTLSRGNVATILWKYGGSKKVSSAANPFKDVKSSMALAWGKSRKIFKADANGNFKPNANCIRGDFAVFLYRYDQQ